MLPQHGTSSLGSFLKAGSIVTHDRVLSVHRALPEHRSLHLSRKGRDCTLWTVATNASLTQSVQKNAMDDLFPGQVKFAVWNFVT